MIDFIRGVPIHIAHDYIVVDVGGIGYRIYCPNPNHFSPQQKEVRIYTHHHVREDAMLLYGFSSREEQELFRRLIEVNGIGPKVALGMMSGAAAQDIAASIEQENVQFLMKLPGIGKKTAQRIVLDLKDKIKSLFPPAEHAVRKDDQADAYTTAEMHDSNTQHWVEAREALKALGYTDAELDRVQRTLQRNHVQQNSVDGWIKLALQHLYQSK